MSDIIKGQLDLFSMLPETGQEPAQDTEAETEKKEKRPAKATGLAKELDKMAQKAYEAKRLNQYQPVIATKEYAGQLADKQCVMHREAWDDEALVSRERFYYDYNTVFEQTSDGQEQLHVFETAREAVDYYFK